MTQVARRHTSPGKSKLGLRFLFFFLSDSVLYFRASGFTYLTAHSSRQPVRLNNFHRTPVMFLEMSQGIADARVITAGLLGRMCHPPLRRNWAHFPFSTHSAVKIEAHGNHQVK